MSLLDSLLFFIQKSSNKPGLPTPNIKMINEKNLHFFSLYLMNKSRASLSSKIRLNNFFWEIHLKDTIDVWRQSSTINQPLKYYLLTPRRFSYWNWIIIFYASVLIWSKWKLTMDIFGQKSLSGILNFGLVSS